jgi:hypothetical protein
MANAVALFTPGAAVCFLSDSAGRRMMGEPSAREVSMQPIGDIFHHRARDDFGEGDHQEYVESGVRDILLIGGAAVVLVGAFVASLF